MTNYLKTKGIYPDMFDSMADYMAVYNLVESFRKDLNYAVETLELIEKLQKNGNTVDVTDVVKRLKQSI